jgi:hypothetical protein
MKGTQDMKIGIRLAAASGAAALLAGCQPSVASLDCGEIAKEAERIWSEAENQPIRVTDIRNEKEVSRNDNEARCSGDATLSDNSTAPVYMRAYKAENGSVQIESGGAPFTE